MFDFFSSTVKQSSINPVISVESWPLLLEVNSAAVQVTDGICVCRQLPSVRHIYKNILAWAGKFEQTHEAIVPRKVFQALEGGQANVSHNFSRISSSGQYISPFPPQGNAQKVRSEENLLSPQSEFIFVMRFFGNLKTNLI